MNKAKLRWILALMVSIASISAFSAEVPYCTSLKDDDANRIALCKNTIETATAGLKGKELKKATAILTDVVTELLEDRAALSGSSGNTLQPNDKKTIPEERYTTLTTETLRQLGYSTTDCGDLGTYYLNKGLRDGSNDDSTETLARTINTAVLKAQKSKVRLYYYLAGFNKANQTSPSGSEDAGSTLKTE